MVEGAVEVDGEWFDEAVGQQVEAEVDVVGVDGWGVEVGDGGADGHGFDEAVAVGADEAQELRGEVVGGGALGGGGVVVVKCELGVGVPGVEHCAVYGDVGDSEAVCSQRHGRHCKRRIAV